MPFTIRPANPQDAEQIAEVHIHAWRESYAGVVPAAHLDGMNVEKRAARHRDSIGKDSYLVAEEEGRIVGFVCFGQDRDSAEPSKGEIYAIYLLDKAKRKGIGGRLMQVAAGELTKKGFKEASLWVLADNPVARAFYEMMGGVVDAASKTVNIGGKDLIEICYRWKDIEVMRRVRSGVSPKPSFKQNADG